MPFVTHGDAAVLVLSASSGIGSRQKKEVGEVVWPEEACTMAQALSMWCQLDKTETSMIYLPHISECRCSDMLYSFVPVHSKRMEVQ